MKDEYGKSEHGNFEVSDTIFFPHPYCITPKHITVASDFGGILGKDAIRSAETKGVHCGIKDCNLDYDQHELGLLISCHIDMKDDEGNVRPELHAYLLKIRDETEKNGYTVFAFKDER